MPLLTLNVIRTSCRIASARERAGGIEVDGSAIEVIEKTDQVMPIFRVRISDYGSLKMRRLSEVMPNDAFELNGGRPQKAALRLFWANTDSCIKLLVPKCIAEQWCHTLSLLCFAWPSFVDQTACMHQSFPKDANSTSR